MVWELWHPPTTTLFYVRGLSKYLKPYPRPMQLDMSCLQAWQLQENCEMGLNIDTIFRPPC